MALPSAGRQCVIAVMGACGQKLLCAFTLQKETPLANAVFWAARKGNLALLQLLLNSGRVDSDCRDSVRTLHALAAWLQLQLAFTIACVGSPSHKQFSIIFFNNILIDESLVCLVFQYLRLEYLLAWHLKKKKGLLTNALLMFFCSVFIPQYGTTALMVASYSGHYECVKELIMQGADINYQRQVQLVTGLVTNNTSARKLLCVLILITSMR